MIDKVPLSLLFCATSLARGVIKGKFLDPVVLRPYCGLKRNVKVRGDEANKYLRGFREPRGILQPCTVEVCIYVTE
jgi:hypothetical protein